MKRIKKMAVMLVVLMATNFSLFAEEEINILFIGNSFTARHNLSELVKEVIEEGNPGLMVNVEARIYGGQNLFKHTEYYFTQSFIEQSIITDSTIEARIQKMKELLKLEDSPVANINMAINRHENLLKNNSRTKWDFVVLQSWMDEVPDMNDGYAKYAKILGDIAKEQGAEVILYITAPDVQNKAPVSGPVKQETVDQDISLVLDLAEIIEPHGVVHVPLAINKIQEGGTDLTFRYENDFHPNQRTAFLTANMFYAALFGESTEGFNFNAVTETKTHTTEEQPNVKLDPDGNPATLVFEEDEKTYLQQVAYNAIIRFNQLWKGEDPIPVSEISIVNAPADTIDLGKNYQLYVSIKPLYATNKSVIWEVTSGNAVTVDENGWFTPLSAGETTITATTNDGGYTDECTLVVDLVNSTNEIGSNPNGIKVYPNPVQDKLFFEFPGSGLKRNIAVYNTLGQLLLSEKTNNSHLEIDVSNFLQNKILIVEVCIGENAEFFKVLTNT